MGVVGLSCDLFQPKFQMQNFNHHILNLEHSGEFFKIFLFVCLLRNTPRKGTIFTHCDLMRALKINFIFSKSRHFSSRNKTYFSFALYKVWAKVSQTLDQNLFSFLKGEQCYSSNLFHFLF